jgi:hypothetical protein
LTAQLFADGVCAILLGESIKCKKQEVVNAISTAKRARSERKGNSNPFATGGAFTNMSGIEIAEQTTKIRIAKKRKAEVADSKAMPAPPGRIGRVGTVASGSIRSSMKRKGTRAAPGRLTAAEVGR